MRAAVACGHLSTPVAAARCQLEPIRARSVEKWVTCWHPLALEEGLVAELERKSKRAGFWDNAAKEAAPLDSVTLPDFVIAPVPANDARFGDESAKVRLSRDHCEVVRKSGRWYIAESGV